MRVNVLLYEPGKENEGIHSLELSGKTVVLMFEDIDDADRYAGLLEAQDFPTPSVQCFDQEEIEEFCFKSGYEAKLVEKGFVPNTEEERLLLSPPQVNKDVTNWNNDDNQHSLDDLDDFRKKLEELL